MGNFNDLISSFWKTHFWLSKTFFPPFQNFILNSISMTLFPPFQALCRNIKIVNDSISPFWFNINDSFSTWIYCTICVFRWFQFKMESGKTPSREIETTLNFICSLHCSKVIPWNLEKKLLKSQNSCQIFWLSKMSISSKISYLYTCVDTPLNRK